jgi:hypothetical protein
MSNKASHLLFDLIKSLSSAEKRYFKIFSGRHLSNDKKGSLLLFEAIEGQDQYDEAALLGNFKDEPFVKHFSITKNRLYHQVLKSLDAFHIQNSTEAELNQYLHYAEILFQKALYVQSGRILSTAHRLAMKNEKWAIMLQIIKKQKRLAETNQYEGSNAMEIDTLFELEQEIIQKVLAESFLWKEKSKIFLELFKKGQVRDPKMAAKLKPSVQKLRSQYATGGQSFEAAYLTNHTESAYFFTIGDYKRSYDAFKKNMELVEGNLELIKDEPGVYIGIATNLVYVCAKLNKFEEADIYLHKSRNLPKILSGKVNDDLNLRTFTNTYSLELAVCNITGNVIRGKFLLIEVEKELPKWEDKLSDVRKASFYHSMSTLYFILGNLKKALFWNNALLNNIPIDKTEDQFCFAQMFHLVIHIELENYEVLPHTIKSLVRYLETRKRQFRFEALFLDFVKTIYKTTTKEERFEQYKAFSAKLKAIESNPLEKTVFEYFDFQAWAESKLSDSTVSEILQIKAPMKDLL